MFVITLRVITVCLPLTLSQIHTFKGGNWKVQTPLITSHRGTCTIHVHIREVNGLLYYITCFMHTCTLQLCIYPHLHTSYGYPHRPVDRYHLAPHCMRSLAVLT